MAPFCFVKERQSKTLGYEKEFSKHHATLLRQPVNKKKKATLLEVA